MFDRTTFSPEFDYSDLRGRIRAVCKTEGAFAKMIGRTQNYLTSVFQGKSYFDSRDIKRACIVLDIDIDDIGKYFFAKTVHDSEKE